MAKKNKKKEKVCEIFEINKKGKEEIKEVCGTKETEITKKKQIETEKKQLKRILIGIGIIAILFVLIIVYFSLMSHFKYEGVTFTIWKDEGGRIFYKTSIPVEYKDGITGKVVSANYNFNIRNDPRELDKIPVTGKIDFRKNIVFDVTTEELFCDGDWNIAIGNMPNLYSLLGMNLLEKNNDIKYEPKNEFMFITINEGEQTEIKQVGENIYEMNVNNCEILKATERLMVETFIQFNKLN